MNALRGFPGAKKVKNSTWYRRMIRKMIPWKPDRESHHLNLKIFPRMKKTSSTRRLPGLQKKDLRPKELCPGILKEKDGAMTGRRAGKGLPVTAANPAMADRPSLKRITTPGNDGPIRMIERREITPGENPALNILNEKNGPTTGRFARTELHGMARDPAAAVRPSLKRITTPGNDGPIQAKDRHEITPGENPAIRIPREKNGPTTGHYARTGPHGMARDPVTASLKQITTPGNAGPIRMRDRHVFSPGEDPALRILNKKNGPTTNLHIRAGLQDRRGSRVPEPAMA